MQPDGKIRRPDAGVKTLTASDLVDGDVHARTHIRSVLRTFLLLVLVFSGTLHLRQALGSLEAPDVFRKDFLQEYLLARAVLDGNDPYSPVTSLARRFISDVPVPVLPHPTPHPPPVALLALPLGLVKYQAAASVWLAFELVCLSASLWLLLKGIGVSPSAGVLIIFTLIGVGLAPVWTGLMVGQLMLLLLLLLSGAWLALRERRDRLGGALLGFALALKLMGIPILLFLALRKRWTAAISASIALAAANLVAVLMIGIGPVFTYYAEVSRLIFPLYRSAAPNISAWSIGWRLFDGTGSPLLLAFRAPPFLYSPMAAALVSIAIPLLLVAGVLYLAVRANDFDLSFGMLICVSIVFHPVAWVHYLVLIAIPLLIAVDKLRALRFPRRESIFLLALAFILDLPPETVSGMSTAFATSRYSSQEQLVPAAPALFGLIYTVAVVALVWFLWRIDQARARQAAGAEKYVHQ